MGLAAPRPCTYPGCNTLLHDGSGRCEKHRKLVRKQQDEVRGSAASRLYDYRWQKASESYRRQHPMCECEECAAAPLELQHAAEVVDHRIPHKGDVRLFWDKSNWQSMSKQHHDRKTAREDGGFGNAVAPRDTPPG